jgi:exodeoxyribonuclease VII large subunit
MFGDYLKKVKFEPKNGDDVTVLCSVSVYTPRGTYSLRVYELNKKGIGQNLLELEELKKKLFAEGLFDASRKREINIYPQRVGVITALNSAAIKDIVYNLKRRYPPVEIFVFPSSVQGDNAPKELLKAFLSSQNYDLDALIIGRGGGTSEDLSAFNDETLVRAVATSNCPVISAVGHEIDTTLIDLIADKRASTPTGAAELATIDKRELEETMTNMLFAMQDSIKKKLQEQKDTLEELKEDLQQGIINAINKTSEVLKLKKAHLESLSPKSVLNRGYSITYGKDHKVINKNNIKPGETIITVTKDMEITSKVEEIK